MSVHANRNKGARRQLMICAVLRKKLFVFSTVPQILAKRLEIRLRLRNRHEQLNARSISTRPFQLITELYPNVPSTTCDTFH
jgi:hypothetical protein